MVVINKLAGLLLLLLSIFSIGAYAKARETTLVTREGLKLWSDSFGKPTDPPILLIIGAGAQCLLWPEEFCQQLAKQGYFVIRYDHRDTGRSTAVNYEQQPYTVMDLTKDALAVLDGYHLEKAHIVGFSMGGEIAQFIGAYFPDRALSLTLVATSISMKPGFDAFEGKHRAGDLSAPLDEYLKWVGRSIPTQQTTKEKIEDFVHSWRLLNGNALLFDEKLYRNIATQCFSRSQLCYPNVNHAKAMQASFSDHEKAPGLIKANTLILHGTADPIFGVDHADALKVAIPQAKIVIIDNMGHSLNPAFYNEIINVLSTHTSIREVRSAKW